MVHLVPDEGVDDGPVLGTATVAIDTDDELRRASPHCVHATEHRLLVDTLADRSAPPPPRPHGGLRMTDNAAPARTTTSSTASRRSRSTTSSSIPGYSETLPDAVDTTATFAADIELAVPLVSAAMDKVTEGRMADRHGPPRRHRRDPPQHVDRRSGRRGPEGEALARAGMITDPVTLRADRHCCTTPRR